jgi:hypothetical protein
MGTPERRQKLLLMKFRQINSEEKKQIHDLDPVKGGKTTDVVRCHVLLQKN